jgi:PAS domain S-box-containing protein
MTDFFRDLERLEMGSRGCESSAVVAAEHHLRLLADLSREMSATLELDGMARVIITRLVELTGAGRGLLLLANAQGGLRIFKALDACGIPLPAESSHYDRVIAERILESGEPVAIRGAPSVVAVPLEGNRGRFGILYVDREDADPGLGADELLLARLVGAQASHALDLLRLEEERRRAQKIELENTFLRRLSRRQAEQARIVERLNQELEGRTRELTQASTFLQAVLHSSTVHAIVAIDLEGRINTFNTGASLIYGWRPEEVVGRHSIKVLFREEDRNGGLLAEMAAAAESEGGGFSAETVRVGKDGVELPVQVTMTAMHDTEGQLTGYLDVSRNVSRERRLRQQVLLSEKMAALGTLAAGVAHEFNNLLQGIIGFLGHALDNGDPRLTTRAIEVSLDAAQRAAGLTGRLQSFARPNVSGLVPMATSELVEEALALVERSFASEGIEVVRSYCSEAPRALVDRSRLGQVILNLLTNARHALSPSDTRRVEVSTGVEPGWVTIAVEDTGCGIPEDKLNRIFEPFYTTKGALGGRIYDGKVHGTGLGLAISQGIVTEHGGRIDVTSREGEGTRFVIRLRPADRGSARVLDHDEADPREEEPPARALEVLVVDDEPTIRDYLRVVLESRGHSITTAADGEEALELLGKSDFDVVVADYQMPRMDGGRLFGTLASEGWERPLPRRILITGRVEAGGGESEVPVDAVLRKPFGTREIVEVVEVRQRSRVGPG